MSLPVPPPHEGQTLAAATTHDNKLDLGSTIVGSPLLNSYKITSSQPFGFVAASGSNLVVNAGRKGSPSVASAFTAGGGYMLCSDGHSTSSPSELNFFVDVDLTLQGNGGEVTLRHHEQLVDRGRQVHRWRLLWKARMRG